MQDFSSEYRNLGYVIDNAASILLFAHTRPDPDAIGANIALKNYIESLGKKADIACLDTVPDFAEKLFPIQFIHPDSVDFSAYDAVIASDSVDRGFNQIIGRIPEDKVIVLIDHHPGIRIEGDINIIDIGFCSSSEIVYHFLRAQGKDISQSIATPLLLGILGDTGGLQHSNTTSEVMTIVSDLIRRGAKLPKIADNVFCNKEMGTLKLWGRALAKAKINPTNGMIYSAITKNDIEELGNPPTEELYIAATLLDQTPDAKFSLLFFQLDDDTIRGSFRTEPYKGVDVSVLARAFGGGGHALASGFEIKGRIVETKNGWEIR